MTFALPATAEVPFAVASGAFVAATFAPAACAKGGTGASPAPSPADALKADPAPWRLPVRSPPSRRIP
eukprot:4480674-Lingulodinium_polyedra.AAC.1